MKKYISFLATAILLFTSCVDDFEAEISATAPGDVIRIELKTKDNAQVSRSAATDDEKAIHNAFVYVFNSSGAKVYAGTRDDLTGSGTTGTITLKINRYNITDPMTVAVITNVGEINQVSEVSTDDLMAVSSYADLQMLRVDKDANLSSNTMLERGDMFVMYGEAKLAAAGSTTTVTVERIDAKVKFNITVGTPDASKKISGLRFYPSQWRVCDVPTTSFLFNTTKAETDAGGDDAYADTPQWYNFESVTNGGSEGSFITQADSGQASFEFYVPESIKYGSIGTDGTDKEKYNKRDKRKADGTFEYAPANATYVEFAGVVEYNKINDDGNLESIMANALFTVHLGGLDKNGTSYSKNWNNFSSYGNTHYTYNITILGAEDILANVDGDGNSGISGEHTVTEFNKSVDAYNNVFNIGLDRSKLGDIKWYVKTPFSYGFSDTDAPKDYKWIYFLHKSTPDDNFLTYPGKNEVYDFDIDIPIKDIDGNVVDWGNVVEFYDTYAADINAGTDKMLNVDQLTKVLYYAKDIAGSPLFQSDGKAHFTIFVDDYYYEENPEDGTSGKMLWQKFANAQTRILNITSLYRKSDDTQSISMTSMYNITQNSIQTMYNTAPLDAGETEYTAFGSQFYPLSKPGSLDDAADFTAKGSGETRLIGNKSGNLPTTVNDEFNGRKNYIGILKSLNGDVLPRWDKYIEPKTWSLKDDYDYPMFRPLLMNRDTNGDGDIDEDEIQWYLASLSQLIDLWVGEDSFNNVSKLYLHNDWSDAHQKDQHYISSTIKDSKIWVLWSAEGAAIGPYDNDGPNDADNLYYRAVRNLGVPRTSTDAPDRIGHRRYETDADGTGHTYIIMNRLSPLSLRPSLTTGKQAIHTERSETNRPYKKFEINTTVYNNTSYNFYDAQDLDLGEWRIPNQRELILMMSIPSEDNYTNDTFTLEGKTAMSATRFGWGQYEGVNLWDKTRPGFFKTDDNLLSLFSYTYRLGFSGWYYKGNGASDDGAKIYRVKDVAN